MLKCLVVDDHHDGAEALGAFLTMLGAQVRVCFTGEAAIDIARYLRPRLVVLDINMPGLDGFETAKQLQQQEWAHIATFVAHTGMAWPPKGAAQAARFHHFLIKGDSTVQFETIVARLLMTDLH